MTIRVAATVVSHWHALFDAAYLRQLIAERADGASTGHAGLPHAA
jgi:hypothetical protein